MRVILLGLALAGSTFAQPAELATLATPAPAVAFVVAKTGKVATVLCADQKVLVWALPEGRLTQQIDLGERAMYPLAFAISDDGVWVAASDYDGLLTVWNSSTGAVQMEVKLPFYSIKLVFSPDGDRLAFAPSGESVQIYDVASGRKALELERTLGGSQSVAFSRDGARIASGDSDTVVRIYDAKNGELLARFTDFLLEPLAAAFSADGKQLLAAGADKIIATLDASTGAVIRKSGKLADPVAYLEVSPDGSLAAAGLMHADNLMLPAPLLITETSSGREVQAWMPASLMVGGGWTSDGRLLAATGVENGVKVWQVR